MENPRFLRPRTFWYMGILSIVGGIMLYGLTSRAPLEMHVQHDRNPLFVTLSDGTIRNGYNINILNKTYEDRTYRLSVRGIEGAELRVQGAGTVDAEALHVFADKVGHYRVFVTAPKQSDARAPVEFLLEEVPGASASEQLASEQYDSIFVSARK